MDLLNQTVFVKGNGKIILPEKIVLPNVKRLLLPDEGFVAGDSDLQQADAQVVAWEADDDILKEIFRDPNLDLHTENAKMIFGTCPSKGHPNRKKAKAGCHAVNYHVYAPTLAKTLGITVHEADTFIKRWFEIHPNIKKWHLRTHNEMMGRGYIENKFGGRKYFYGRTDGPTALSEALAWVPQSTVGLVINTVWEKLDGYPLEEFEVKLQVHDSLGFQIRKDLVRKYVGIIQQAFDSVVIPYDDPLVIGSDIALGENFGDVIDISWDGYIKDKDGIPTEEVISYWREAA